MSLKKKSPEKWRVIECVPVEDVAFAYCEGGCERQLLRPVAEPMDAEAYCPECMKQLLVDLAAIGANVEARYVRSH
jgi:hypothetical protein